MTPSHENWKADTVISRLRLDYAKYSHCKVLLGETSADLFQMHLHNVNEAHFNRRPQNEAHFNRRPQFYFSRHSYTHSYFSVIKINYILSLYINLNDFYSFNPTLSLYSFYWFYRISFFALKLMEPSTVWGSAIKFMALVPKTLDRFSI